MKKAYWVIAAFFIYFICLNPALAIAATYTIAADSIWANDGDQTQTSVTHAKAGDNVNVNGHSLIVSGSATANDGGGLYNFTLGDITGSNSTSVLDIGWGNDNAFSVTINSVNITDPVGRMQVDNGWDDTEAITAIVTNGVTVNELDIRHYSTTAAANVALTVNDALSATTTVISALGRGAGSGNATLTLNGSSIALGTCTFNNGTSDLGTTTLTLSGSGDQTVTGTINGANAGDGVLNVNGTGNTTISNAVGTTSLKEINIAAATGKTAEFDSTAGATTITMSGAGKAQFDGAVTATSLNITGVGETDINAASNITTTTFTGAGTLDVNQTLAGAVAFGAGSTNAVIDLLGGENITGAINNTSGSDDVGTLNITGSGSSSIGGAVGASGAGLKEIDIDNTGTTSFGGSVYAKILSFVQAGIVTINGNSTIDELTGSGGTLKNGGSADYALTVGDSVSTSFGGIIADGTTNSLSLTKQGSGTLTLSGTNTYSGGTTINAGKLVAGNANAVGTGALTNNATLDVGTTNLSVTGVYTQNAGSTLSTTVNSALTSGKITSGVAAVVNTASTVAVTIADNVYLPSNTTFTVIDTGGAGIGNIPGTITSSSSRIAFTRANSGGNLILTVNRSATGFASTATNSNADAVGKVLDNITSPSSDMTTILNTMEGLSNSQVASALDTMDPEVDAGTLNNSTAMLENFVSVAIERVRDILRLAQSPSANMGTGVSTGDDELVNGIWGKGYGSYLNQGTRKGIQGYDAWNVGTALGIDRLFADLATIGMSGGWAYGNVDSDANNANTYINSAQATLYAGYRNDTYPFYIDASGSFAWNWYNGKRDISVGNTNRTANASYDGQQYGVYLGGGYDFPVYKKVNLTPLLSLQWMRLNLQSYTETEAGAMNLSVASQSYDILQSGVGLA